jgi:hypothetical protein
MAAKKIIAHGRDVARVITCARCKGIKIPYVLYVEEPRGEDVAYMGL